MSIKFQTVGWLSAANIYEVNVRQYTPEGTFKAFSAHLHRLREMGVSILWLMPVTPISKEKRKGSLGSYYACSSYTEINPEFGDKADFKALIDQAHALGFKIIIDWVANHTGWDHVWTENPDWYARDEAGNFTEIHGWEDVIDLNFDNTEMQSAMIDAMKYWVGMFDIDGFRCDMAHLVQLDFWQKARQSLGKIKQLLWLGECDESNYSEVFDLTYSWRWMHATEHFAKNPGPETFTEIKQALQLYMDLPPGAKKLFFTSNHDENSWNGTEYEKYGLPLAYTLAALTCLLPGTPLIYSGQELPNKKRLKFFDKDAIEWSSEPAPQLAGFYSHLLQLRKNHPAFAADASFQWLSLGTEQQPVLAFLLQLKGTHPGKALLLLNCSATASCSIEIQDHADADTQQSLLQGKYRLIEPVPVTAGQPEPAAAQPLPADLAFTLAPGAVRIYLS